MNDATNLEMDCESANMKYELLLKSNADIRQHVSNEIVQDIFDVCILDLEYSITTFLTLFILKISFFEKRKRVGRTWFGRGLEMFRALEGDLKLLITTSFMKSPCLF